MTTVWSLPQIEFRDLVSLRETRPTALLTGERSWGAVSSLLELPIVVQAEPQRVDLDYLDDMADGLPDAVEVVYAVGGGLVSDVAKYLGWKRNLPTVVIPTALSQDGFFTSLVAGRVGGTVSYTTTGPVPRILIDWDIIRNAPPSVRGAGITELLTIVTGLLDWRYAAGKNRTTPETRYKRWAANVMAGIAQQAFKIAEGVGRGHVESLRELLDLICLEVQLTNQLGHNRPQEGSEQFFAYAIEPKVTRGRPYPYAELVGPGILVASVLHGQDVSAIRGTMESAGIRLDRLPADSIRDTIKILPEYVRKHRLPYSVLNDTDMTSERAEDILARAGLLTSGMDA
jgi:glycerol-1-phosphate dehydrogenase [NAD(P)+]